MKFYCSPTEGISINPDIAVTNIQKVLLDGEEVTYHEAGEDLILTINNIGQRTRKRVSEVLYSALGITFGEICEQAA
jgi:hypothetical protein